jgi:nucleoside 2-deoxyribosyltransferase
MNKKTFLICPVRNHDMSETIKYVEMLEADGWTVYWPPRDTNQDDPTGYQICLDNVGAISEADAVHIVFDPTSEGSKFDLGATFALRKPLIVLNTIEPTDGKSFANMILEWTNSGLV